MLSSGLLFGRYLSSNLGETESPACFVVHFLYHYRQAPSFHNFSVWLFYKLHTLYRSLNTTMAQPKNCPFEVNNTIELKNITTKSDSKSTIVISRGVFRLTSVPVLSHIFVICLSSIVVLTPNGQFLDCAFIAFRKRYEENIVKCSAYFFFFFFFLFFFFFFFFPSSSTFLLRLLLALHFVTALVFF